MTATPPPEPRLRGLRVGVTGARKAEQFATALADRGAEPVVGPTLLGDLPVPDDELLADTATVLRGRPAWVVASTGTGMRLWLDAADRGGLGEDLRACLAAARCVARGAKAKGGLAAAGVRPLWTSPEETDGSVAAWLRERVDAAETVAVQLHGGTTTAYDVLAATGADVVTVMPYLSAPPQDDGPARRLVEALVAGRVDLVTFTSPGAARNLYAIAATMGEDTLAGVRRSLAGEVAVASIGAVTSEALAELGATVTVVPKRHRTGELLRAIEAWWSEVS